MLKYFLRCITDLHLAWIFIINRRQFDDESVICFFAKFMVIDYGGLFFGPPDICFMKLL